MTARVAASANTSVDELREQLRAAVEKRNLVADRVKRLESELQRHREIQCHANAAVGSATANLLAHGLGNLHEILGYASAGDVLADADFEALFLPKTEDECDD